MCHQKSKNKESYVFDRCKAYLKVNKLSKTKEKQNSSYQNNEVAGCKSTVV